MLREEPFGALDAQTKLQMQEWLMQLWSDFRKTVVFVTHDVDEAIGLGDRVATLRLEGQSPKGLLAREFALADRLVFAKVKAAVGGRMRFFVSGSAPLAPELPVAWAVLPEAPDALGPEALPPLEALLELPPQAARKAAAAAAPPVNAMARLRLSRLVVTDAQ